MKRIVAFVLAFVAGWVTGWAVWVAVSAYWMLRDADS